MYAATCFIFSCVVRGETENGGCVNPGHAERSMRVVARRVAPPSHAPARAQHTRSRACLSSCVKKSCSYLHELLSTNKTNALCRTFCRTNFGQVARCCCGRTLTLPWVWAHRYRCVVVGIAPARHHGFKTGADGFTPKFGHVVPNGHSRLSNNTGPSPFVSMRSCVRACMRACVRACVR